MSNLLNPYFNNLGIVTDSLLMYYDMSNTLSYPRSGTTLFDLTTNGHNATLVGGPSYVSSEGESINFDGADDYAQASIPSTSITNITMTGFVNVVLNSKGPYFRNGNGGNGYALGIGSGSFDSAGNNIIALFPGIRWIATASVYSAGWQMITLTLNASSVVSGYINTTPISFPTGSNPAIPTTNLFLARNFGDEPGGVRAANCRIGNFMFYGKSLSDLEISQNFNAIRGRYGI
jgi:hypothetical protein